MPTSRGRSLSWRQGRQWVNGLYAPGAEVFDIAGKESEAVALDRGGDNYVGQAWRVTLTARLVGQGSRKGTTALLGRAMDTEKVCKARD